jgi:hypothetical protein
LRFPPSGIVFGVFAATMAFAASGAIILVLWEGGREVISGAMSVGRLHLACAFVSTDAHSLIFMSAAAVPRYPDVVHSVHRERGWRIGRVVFTLWRLHEGHR